jgi:nitric oxide reductase subunit C
LEGQGGQVGPNLDGVGSRKTSDEIRRWLRDPAAVKPGTAMPKLPLSEEQIGELAAFLSQKKGATP